MGIPGTAAWNTAGGGQGMLGNFHCHRYRFVLLVETPLRLNEFAGSTLRGGFGHTFKRTVCIWPPGDCPRCLLKNTCSYPYIFEAAPPPVRSSHDLPGNFRTVIHGGDASSRPYRPSRFRRRKQT